MRGRRRACSGLVCASTGAAAAGGEGTAEQKGDLPLLARVDAFLSAFWKFLRPHTIRGTILGSFAVTTRALIECPVVSVAATAKQLLACTRRYVLELCPPVLACCGEAHLTSSSRSCKKLLCWWYAGVTKPYVLCEVSKEMYCSSKH